MNLSQLVGRIDARLAAIGLSDRQACLRAGLKADAIRTIRRGQEPKISKLNRLAPILGVPPEYLIGAIELDEQEASSNVLKPFAPSGYLWVRAIKEPTPKGKTAKAELLPSHLINEVLSGQADDFSIGRVSGSAMAPTLLDGDHILVDLRKRLPVPPGVFALHEVGGFSIRWLETIPSVEAPKYRVRFEDTRYEPCDLRPEEVRVIGRVVWFSRCLP